MALDIYPPMNLPGQAVPWGREVQRDQRQLDDRLSNVESTSSNLLRGDAGQLAALAQQLEEVSYRWIRQVEGPSLSYRATVAGSAKVEFTQTGTVTLPLPDSLPRKVIVTAAAVFNGATEGTFIPACEGAVNIFYNDTPVLAFADFFGAKASDPIPEGSGVSRRILRTYAGDTSITFQVQFRGSMTNVLSTAQIFSVWLTNFSISYAVGDTLDH